MCIGVHVVIGMFFLRDQPFSTIKAIIYSEITEISLVSIDLMLYHQLIQLWFLDWVRDVCTDEVLCNQDVDTF